MAFILVLAGLILLVLSGDFLVKGAVSLSLKLGVPALIVYMNKVDQVDDDEILELVEMELRELLDSYEFPGDDIPVVMGTALGALEDKDEKTGRDSIVALMAAVDEYIPAPERDAQ